MAIPVGGLSPLALYIVVVRSSFELLDLPPTCYARKKAHSSSISRPAAPSYVLMYECVGDESLKWPPSLFCNGSRGHLFPPLSLVLCSSNEEGGNES